MIRKLYLRWSFLGLAVLVLIGTGIFVLWALNGPLLEPEAFAAQVSDEQVAVEIGHWYVYTPQEIELDVGLIFYPGGRVPAGAYAPQARAIAEEGYLVIVPEMTLKLAIFSMNTACFC